MAENGKHATVLNAITKRHAQKWKSILMGNEVLREKQEVENQPLEIQPIENHLN